MDSENKPIKKVKNGSLGEIQKLMDHIDKHACSECKHLVIDKKETYKLSLTNRRFEGGQKISEVMAHCSKKESSKTGKIIEFKVYKGTMKCFNSKYLDYEIN